jgi:hypothetical protein
MLASCTPVHRGLKKQTKQQQKNLNMSNTPINLKKKKK